MVVELKRDLRIQSETEGLKAVREFVGEVVRASQMDALLQNRITLAIDEAVTNIIKHAYEEGRKDWIEIQIDVSPTRFLVVILDTGRSFNPKRVDPLDIADNIQRGHQGGLGIFLMRQIMDEVEYTFREGIKNELRMVKYL